MNEFNKKTGKLLRAAREAQGCSVAYVAAIMCIGRQVVYDMEHGRRGHTVAAVDRYAKAIGLKGWRQLATYTASPVVAAAQKK